MKRKTVFVYAGLILALVCSLVLAGCPNEPDDDEAGIDERLVHSWTNDPNNAYTISNDLIGLEKRFTINSDATFSADINVIFLLACKGAGVDLNNPSLPMVAGIATTNFTDGAGVDQLCWTVTGKLTKVDDEIYTIPDLLARGPNGVGALAGVTPSIVEAFRTAPMRLYVVDDTHFVFESGASEPDADVNAFFGGNYTVSE
jgi:hypothetical protein